MSYNLAMNRRRKNNLLPLAATALLLLLTGCAGNSYWTWQHPQQQAPQERQQALAECRDLARQEALQSRHLYYFDDPFWGAPFYRNRFYRPYSSWYYQDHLFAYQRELDRYTRLCMKAKGWQWVQVTPEPAQQKPIQPTP